MAPQDHQPAVGEIKRIMKTQGRAYLSTTRCRISFMDDDEWEEVLKEFKVIERNYPPYHGERWAKVTKE